MPRLVRAVKDEGTPCSAGGVLSRYQVNVESYDLSYVGHLFFDEKLNGLE